MMEPVLTEPPSLPDGVIDTPRFRERAPPSLSLETPEDTPVSSTAGPHTTRARPQTTRGSNPTFPQFVHGSTAERLESLSVDGSNLNKGSSNPTELTIANVAPPTPARPNTTTFSGRRRSA